MPPRSPTSRAREPWGRDRATRARLVTAAAALALVSVDASAREAWPVDVGRTRVAGRVASFRELRDRGVVRQAYDYSCGAAAFATLLRHGFGEEIGEEEVLEWLFAHSSADEQRLIRNKGLSLLDMRKLAVERGYRAHAFRLGPDQLRRVRRPVIVFIRPSGYAHFAVLRGFRGDRALLADPSQGNWSVPLPRFLSMWLDETGRGVLFVAEKPDGRWPASSPLYVGSGGAPPPPPPLTPRRALDAARPSMQDPASLPRLP